MLYNLKIHNLKVLFYALIILLPFYTASADVSYELSISEAARAIRSPGDMMLQKDQCWQNYHLFLRTKFNPSFQIKNTTPANLNKNITRLRIELKKPGYLFDTFMDYTGISSYFTDFSERALLSPDTIDGGVLSSFIDISFAGRPIKSGEQFSFRTAIRPSSGAIDPFLDYKDVLFDRTGNFRGDNAVIQVTFSDGTVLPYFQLFEFRSPFSTKPSTDVLTPEQNYEDSYQCAWARSWYWYCADKAGIDGDSAHFIITQKKCAPPTFTPTRTPTKTPSKTPTYTPTPQRTYPLPTATPTPYTFHTSTPTPPSFRTPQPTPTNLVPKLIEPKINCVMETGSGNARFVIGYTNFNAFAVNISQGTDNSLNKNLFSIDGNPVSSQPAEFFPGQNDSAASIIARKDSVLKWILKFAGQPAREVVSNSNVPACTTSLDCIDENIRELQFAVDIDAAKLSKIVEKLARNLAKVDPSAKADSIALRKEAKSLYIKSWTSIWSLPQILTICPANSICAQSDNTALVNNLSDNNSKLLKLAQSTAKRIKSQAGDRKIEKKLLNAARALFKGNLKTINLVPKIASVCSNSDNL